MHQPYVVALSAEVNGRLICSSKSREKRTGQPNNGKQPPLALGEGRACLFPHHISLRIYPVVADLKLWMYRQWLLLKYGRRLGFI